MVQIQFPEPSINATLAVTRTKRTNTTENNIFFFTTQRPTRTKWCWYKSITFCVRKSSIIIIYISSFTMILLCLFVEFCHLPQFHKLPQAHRQCSSPQKYASYRLNTTPTSQQRVDIHLVYNQWHIFNIKVMK